MAANCCRGAHAPHKVHESLDVHCGSPLYRDPEGPLACALSIAGLHLRRRSAPGKATCILSPSTAGR